MPSAKTIDDIFDPARSTTGYMLDSTGTLVSKAANEARFPAYDGDGNALGLLIEEEREHMLPYSEDMTNAGWLKVKVGTADNATVAPDGNTTADLIYEDTDTGEHYLEDGYATGPGTYALSGFLKAGPGTRQAYIRPVHSGSAEGGTSSVVLDLATGVMGTPAGAITSARAVHYGNGWYRYEVVLTVTGGTTSIVNRVHIYNGSSISYAGDGASGFYFWGGQIEEGASVTSYYPTSGSTQIRAKDTNVFDTDWFNAVYNPSAGTMVWEFNIPAASGGNMHLGGFSDGSANNSIHALVQTDGDVRFIIQQGGVQQANIDAGNYTFGTTAKLAVSWGSGSAKASLNGATAVTGTPATLPTCTEGAVGHSASSTTGHINGYIVDWQYKRKEYDAADIEAAAT